MLQRLIRQKPPALADRLPNARHVSSDVVSKVQDGKQDRLERLRCLAWDEELSDSAAARDALRRTRMVNGKVRPWREVSVRLHGETHAEASRDVGLTVLALHESGDLVVSAGLNALEVLPKRVPVLWDLAQGTMNIGFDAISFVVPARALVPREPNAAGPDDKREAGVRHRDDKKPLLSVRPRGMDDATYALISQMGIDPDQQAQALAAHKAHLPAPQPKSLLIYFKQIHAGPNQSDQQKDEVVGSQKAILDELLSCGMELDTLFVEAQAGTWRQDQCPEGLRNDALRLFGSYKSHDALSAEQREFLYTCDAAHLYAILRPKVVLEGTTTDGKQASAQMYVDQNPDMWKGMTPEQWHIIYKQRESIAVGRIRKWFAQRPAGAVAGLIYGGSHPFENYESPLGAEVAVFKSADRDMSLGPQPRGPLRPDSLLPGKSAGASKTGNP